MNEKEIAELRRRFRPDKCGITHVHGCYVNESREIVSQFDQSLGMMSQDESEKMLSLLKRTISGTVGKNLIDIDFTTRQVMDGEEHKLLMALRKSELNDTDAVQTFFHQVIDHLALDTSYLILLAKDAYDVPYRSKDGDKQSDASADVFSYILCSICPVKLTKSALSYAAHENRFYNHATDWVISPPELGFLFPAFDDRCTNIYGSLYYSRDIGESHQEFVDAVFHSELPMPAAAQKQTFETILSDTLAEECSYEVVQAVHGQISQLIEEHKANKETEPLVMSKLAVKRVLTSCGISESREKAFDTEYDEAFGAEADLSPGNIVDTKQFELRTPDVTIRVNPERSDLIKTQMINGAKYILIRADEGIEVNGVNIQIS
ncbi:MAG: DUF4317 domain-containing protein [Oscillospiraceae bacterium]